MHIGQTNKVTLKGMDAFCYNNKGILTFYWVGYYDYSITFGDRFPWVTYKYKRDHVAWPGIDAIHFIQPVSIDDFGLAKVIGVPRVCQVLPPDCPLRYARVDPRKFAGWRRGGCQRTRGSYFMRGSGTTVPGEKLFLFWNRDFILHLNQWTRHLVRKFFWAN